jgi:hypothetical protein
MDMDQIDLALHGIQQMVEVSLRAAESLRGTDDGLFQMPYEDANLLDFSLFDVEKRVKEARARFARVAGL